MTIPSTGAVSLNDVAAVTKAATGVRIEMNETLTRQLLGRPTTATYIALSDARGKPIATGPMWQFYPFVINNTNGGTYYNTIYFYMNYSYVVPVYQYLTVAVYAAGGGGGGGAWLGYGNGYPGTDAFNSTFNSSTPVIANGGKGGAGELAAPYSNLNGGGSGGTVVTGGGAAGGNGYAGGQKGGAGGRVTKTWRFALDAGYPMWGQTITMSFGQQGKAGGNYWPGIGGPGDWGVRANASFTTT